MIDARFRGRCSACEKHIEEGDQIGLVDGEWCCAECVEEHGEDEADGDVR